jgi:hypothetical protein
MPVSSPPRSTETSVRLLAVDRSVDDSRAERMVEAQNLSSRTGEAIEDPRLRGNRLIRESQLGAKLRLPLPVTSMISRKQATIGVTSFLGGSASRLSSRRNGHAANVRFTGRGRAPQAIKRLLRNVSRDPLCQLLELGAMTISEPLLASTRALEVAFERRSAQTVKIWHDCMDRPRVASRK